MGFSDCVEEKDIYRRDVLIKKIRSLHLRHCHLHHLLHHQPRFLESVTGTSKPRFIYRVR
jgi:hypothetical protein